MSSDTRTALSNVVELIGTKVTVSSLHGAPYLSTENMLPNLGGVGPSKPPAGDRVNNFRKHDTLFSNIRPYFRKVHYAESGGGCSADVLVFRTKDPEAFDPAYLYYCLADPLFIEYTMATCKGAKMPRGDKGAMMLYKLEKPTITVQKRVASLLRGIDNLIAGLRHQNTAIESIAQTQFRSWFVNFDPVHAKAVGNAPEAMSAEISALFPSEFEESSLGAIPKGWCVTTFDDSFGIQGGGTPSTKELSYWDAGTHWWATPKDMSGLTAKVIYSTGRKITDAGVRKISSKILPTNTTLMSSRAPVGYLAIAKAPISINQGFIAIPPTEGVPASFIVELLAYKMPEIKANAGGTTFAEISKTQFRPIKWVRPPKEVLEAYGRIATPLYASVHGNALLIDALANLRDHILPRLISGKLSIGEAEEAVADLVPDLAEAI
jgi:type I restriction enzyme S subunit